MTPTRLRSALVAISLTAGLLGTTTPAGAAPAPALTCGGVGVDPGPIHYRTETLIKASPGAVWRLQTDVAGWPAWQQAVTSASRLDPGPLRPGSRFRWTTPAPPTPTTPGTTLVITSTVEQSLPGRCIRWTGPAIGDGLRIDRGAHVWTFTPVPAGVLVRTEESWRGEQIETDPATANRYLAAGLDAWVAALKATAEARSCGH